MGQTRSRGIAQVKRQHLPIRKDGEYLGVLSGKMEHDLFEYRCYTLYLNAK